MNKFAIRLRDLRREANITAEVLSKVIGCSYATISQWENGRNFPNQSTCEKLCDYFNVSLDYLMGRTDNSDPITAPELKDYQDLDEQQKEMIRTMIKTFKDQNAKK